MGVLQQIREAYPAEYEKRVERISGQKKFTNPELGKTKFFKIKEPMRIENNIISQTVDEIQEVKSPNGEVIYAVVTYEGGKKRENLPQSLSMNAAANIEGLIRKELKGRDPDDDLNISLGSIWQIKGVKNPRSGPEGEFGDVMHNFKLIKLDGNVVGKILSGGGVGSGLNTELKSEDLAKYT